jgi:hypothetical protein
MKVKISKFDFIKSENLKIILNKNKNKEKFGLGAWLN